MVGPRGGGPAAGAGLREVEWHQAPMPPTASSHGTRMVEGGRNTADPGSPTGNPGTKRTTKRVTGLEPATFSLGS